MNIVNIRAHKEEFCILQTTEKSQTATMRLKTGDATSDRLECHPRSEQTVLILEGEVIAEVDQDKHTLHAGEALIIPPGVKHRFVNQSHHEAFAFTSYTPPAYAGKSNA